MINNPNPLQIARAAKNLLDNDDFNMLMSYRAQVLTVETMSLYEKDQILATHQEYRGVKDFYEWIATVAEANE